MNSPRERRLIWAAVAAGFVLRAAVGLAFPRHIMGDQPWYIGTATALLRDGWGFDYPAWEGRAPGATWVLSAVFAVFGEGNLAAVKVVNAATLATGAWLLAAIARHVLPGHPRAPVLAAWLMALNPVDIHFSTLVMSEAYYVPLTLLFVLLCLRLLAGHGWRDAVAAGVVGAAAMHVRGDILTVVGAAAAAGVAILAVRRELTVRRLAAWATVGVVAVGLCIPYCLHLHGRLGRFVFMSDVKAHTAVQERAGWLRWLSNVSLPRRDWLPIYWWGAHECDPAWIPSSAFVDEAEEREVRDLMRRDREARTLLPEVDEEFRRIGDRRAAAHPLRFYVGLPLERSARVWLDPFDSDIAAPTAPTRRSLLGWAFHLWEILYRTIFGVGFLGSLVAAVRLRRAAALPALCLLARTYGLILGGPALIGFAVFESRFLTNMQPLALLFALGAALWVADRRPGLAK